MRPGSLNEGDAPEIKKAAERLPRTEQTFIRVELYQRDNKSKGKGWQASPTGWGNAVARRAPGLKPF
jgi:hypothetical protein